MQWWHQPGAQAGTEPPQSRRKAREMRNELEAAITDVLSQVACCLTDTAEENWASLKPTCWNSLKMMQSLIPDGIWITR